MTGVVFETKMSISTKRRFHTNVAYSYLDKQQPLLVAANSGNAIGLERYACRKCCASIHSNLYTLRIYYEGSLLPQIACFLGKLLIIEHRKFTRLTAKFWEGIKLYIMDVLKLIVRLRKFKSGYMCSNNLSEINISQLTE